MAHPAVTKELIAHLAELARVELTPEENVKYQKDLEEVLSYIDQLNEVDVTGVEPMNGCTELTNIFREDEPQKDALRGQGIGNFPQSQDGYLKVPPVFDK